MILHLKIFLFNFTPSFSFDEQCIHFASKCTAQLIRQSNFTAASPFNQSVSGSNMGVKTRFVTSTAISEIQLKPHLLKSTLRHT